MLSELRRIHYLRVQQSVVKFYLGLPPIFGYINEGEFATAQTDCSDSA